jgi:hypothetical protein
MNVMRRTLLSLAIASALAAGNGTVAALPFQAAGSAADAHIDPEIAAQLLKVKRIYVESFGDDVTSKQMQALLIDALTSTKRFIITENKDKADAIIKGIGTEQTSHELHATKEGTLVGSGRGVAGISDASASTETITQARLTVRLVSANGDVLWSTAKESTGGKYKGAGADVADEVVKQLQRDVDRIR